MINGKLSKVKEDTVSMIPDPIEGKLDPIRNVEGSNLHSYKWVPGNLDSETGAGVHPFLNIFPNIGYQFVGFDIEKEVKEQDTSSKTFSVLTKTKTFSNEFGSSNFTQDESKVNWKTDLLKYTARFNKNLYDIAGECGFFQKGETEGTSDVRLNSVDTITNIKIEISNIQLCDISNMFIMKDPEQITTNSINFNVESITDRNSNDGVDRLSNWLSKKNITIDTNDSKVNNLTVVDDEGTPIATPLDFLKTHKTYVLGDKFKISAQKPDICQRYVFDGWYYYRVNDPTNKYYKLKDSDGNDLTINTTNISIPTSKISLPGKQYSSEITLDENFIKNNNLHQHSDDQVHIVAKWLQTNESVIITSSEGGDVQASQEPTVPRDPNPGGIPEGGETPTV